MQAGFKIQMCSLQETFHAFHHFFFIKCIREETQTAKSQCTSIYLYEYMNLPLRVYPTIPPTASSAAYANPIQSIAMVPTLEEKHIETEDKQVPSS